MKKTAFLFFIFLSASCFAQFSKTHFIPPLCSQDDFVEDQYLYISTPNTSAVNFKIIEIGGNIVAGQVSNNSPYVYTIGQGDDSQLITPKNSIGIVTNKGYIIEAEDLVYVSVRLNATRNNNGGFNQAGGLVSKGNSALGTSFRLGGMLNPNVDDTLLNFGSVLATENNTTITISNLPIGTLFSDGTSYSQPIVVTLNKNESYVLALENYAGNNSPSNSSKMIGALIETDKPVVVNSGSIGGSNSTQSGRDVGFDQIVSFEKTGKEYIFIKALGTDELERVLLIAHKPDTKIFLNGDSVPFSTLVNAGDYVVIDGSIFINNNLYVNASESVFAYQSIAGTNNSANQNLFFVPPLNCATPNTVDNIPLIQSIGNIVFNGSINIVTETGALVKINGTTTSATAVQIQGNPGFVRYSVSGLSGNIAISSSKQVYVSYFSTNNFATYGGYYSGFDLKPDVISDKILVSRSLCIPNLELKINSSSSYDTFRWYKNDILISGATNNSYTPDTPGYYQVQGAISGCPGNGFVFSDKIPVSKCTTNNDNDAANDNIDVDNDNDGLSNCTESIGNQKIDISNYNSGTISVGKFSNSFTGAISTSVTASINPFSSSSDGSFITEIPAGKGNSLTYTMNFGQPISIGLDYVSTANTSDLLNANAEYIINSDVDNTITVLNPDDQLLIDTNYDGIYESGVSQFSSFEIRFRLNSATPLAAGTGTFKFQTYLTNSVRFTHKNLSDDLTNKSTMKIYAVCVPIDSDNDGIPDQLDTDSDNDGIADAIEVQVNAAVSLSNRDLDKNGMDDAFEPGFTPVDYDNDTIPDYLDFDSDNDGILDKVEAATDSDSDGIKNYRDLDSDNDLCLDVVEAGFTDGDGDGKFGNATPSVNSTGLVDGAPYTSPNANYLLSGPIVITTQPLFSPVCELQKSSITIVDNGGCTYQWQLSTDGVNWNNLSNNATYEDVTTNSLIINSVSNTMNGYKYRVQLNKTGNSCGLTSAEATLRIDALPVVNDITIIQCGEDLLGNSIFNLTVKNNEISTNYKIETFTYYKTLAGANDADPLELINTPLSFSNTTAFSMPVWARVVNSNGCFRTAQITLKVLVTNIPSTYSIKVPPTCDDFLDTNGNNNANNDKRDGIATFDLTATKTAIQKLLPTTAGVTYNINYYRNQADALSELNVISDILNYRNIGYPNTQEIWVRVDSDIDNACYGLGPFVTLTVEKLPFANSVVFSRQCDDNQDGTFPFNTASLESTLLGTNQSFPVTVTYFDLADNPLKDANGMLITSPFPSTFNSTSQIIKAVVTNNTSLKCFDETSISFIVDDLPEAFPIPVSLISICDNELNPLNQDGKLAFDTSTFQSTILGGQVGMTVKYFDEKGNLLSSSLPNPFITGSQNIKVIVENPINTSCFAELTIPFIVQALPNISQNIDGSEDKLVCSNDPTFFVQLDAGIQDNTSPSNYSYIWSKDGIVLTDKTEYTLDVNAEGLYKVQVLNSTGCSSTRSIKVTSSDIARIQSIVIVDMTDINTVTINASGQGDYEYSLDEPFGPYQDSNFFYNVPAGIHDVYINDKNGCRPITQTTIAIVGVPKFFTPNNDGYNDYWSVKGVNADFNPNSTIYIFDRFGKLIKQWVPSKSEGWDGTFNGISLPSDDYWYTIKLDDGRESKGHFSLKR